MLGAVSLFRGYCPNRFKVPSYSATTQAQLFSYISLALAFFYSADNFSLPFGLAKLQ
jgi:hypothetical protein